MVAAVVLRLLGRVSGRESWNEVIEWLKLANRMVGLLRRKQRLRYQATDTLGLEKLVQRTCMLLGCGWQTPVSFCNFLVSLGHGFEDSRDLASA